MPDGARDRREAPRRPWAARLGLTAASLVLSLLLAEAVLRLLGVAPARYAAPRHLESDDKRYAVDLYPDDPRAYFPLDLRDADARRAVRQRLPRVEEAFERTPYGVEHVRSEGLCREPEIAPPDDGVPRVLVLGDSFTEGQGVIAEDTFVAQLDRELEGIELLNCGRRGYDFPQLSERFQELLVHEPDAVLYAMTLNDFAQSEAFRARQAYIDDWIVNRRRTVSEGDGSPPPFEPRIVSVLADRIEGARVGAETTRWYREMVGDDNREGWEATLAAIDAMAAEMESRGGRFGVALWPLLVELDGDYPFESVHDAVGDAMEARGLPYVDALDAFAGENPEALWVHAADRHPNDVAHARFAEVARPLAEELAAR